jgi:hypothetical protein
MTAPDLTAYRAIHRALRTGAARLADAAPGIEGADARRRKAYARYWKGYTGEVLAHHGGEDDIFFPALRERVPVAAEMTGRTDAEHHELDELMDAITEAVDQVRQGNPAPRLAGLTRELADHMQQHLDFEDSDILPLFERHFTAEEYEELDAAMVASLKIGPQAAFTVPFAVSAMTPEETARAVASAPFPLRALLRVCRRPHARLNQRAFGRSLVEVA